MADLEVYDNASNNAPTFGPDTDSDKESMDSTDDAPPDRSVVNPDIDGSGFPQESLEERVSDLTQRVQDLEEDVSELTQENEELQSYNDQLTHPTMKGQDQIDNLSRELKTSKDEIDRLRDELMEKDKSMISLQAKIEELQIQIDKLNSEVERLKGKLAEHERNWGKMYLCQVAVEFEQAICSHVLPEVFSKHNAAKINDLLNMLNHDGGYIPLDPQSHDIEAILSKARYRWERVCEALKLPPEWKKRTGEKKVNYYRPSDPRIFRAIALLRHKRNVVAHPNPVSLQVAEDAVMTDSVRKELEDWQFELVKEFIFSLRTSIIKIGIKTDREKLTLD